jgi:peptidoglycan L-alanyl-D-glutamate endopeptidase CwlK
MMTYALGQGSRKKLEGVHPDLCMVVERAIELSKIDFKVTDGVRTLAQQKALYAQGRTKPGKVVTWTLNSRHLVNATTGFGHAVDLLPAPYDWVLKDDPTTPEVDDNFKKVADAMFHAANELGVAIRWGANWDGDTKIREKGESDNPHFELR